MFANLITVIAFILSGTCLYGQDSLINLSPKLSAAYLDKVSAKTNSLEQKLEKKMEKVLRQMENEDTKMQKKLTKIDPLKSKEIFTNTEQKYKDLTQLLQRKIPVTQYIPSLDTLNTSLRFLQQNSQMISRLKGSEQKLKDALGKTNEVEDKFRQADEIKKFLQERKQLLKEQLSKFGFAKELKKLNKQVYYYSEQLNEYKAMLKDHKKAERKVIELLSETKLFKDFMKKNSMLAALFRLPGGDPSPTVGAGGGLAGLQTRVQVNNLIQQQMGAGGPNARAQLQQNMQDAQSQLNQLKEKLLNASPAGQAGLDGAEMPEGFKPNNQKTKSFLKRFEYGTNVQTQKATNYFPVTSDIDLSLGYKLNDKSVIGIGGSYKMGMGHDWHHIRITNEGMGFRSFIDWKILSSTGGAGGGLWISGGYEQNYKTSPPTPLRMERGTWQQSGLIGLSKLISLKTKLFTKTKLQLLWDFLSYQQVPRTNALLFRIGYLVK
jgi:hypothetical protein